MREGDICETQDQSHKKTDQTMIQAALAHALRLSIDYP